jgi:hypothetical protein
MTYEETPMRILDRKDQVLRNNSISLVKVLWNNPSVEEVFMGIRARDEKQIPTSV